MISRVKQKGQKLMKSDKEEKYWREHPAYRTGYEGFHKHPDKKFEEIETDLAGDYQKHQPALPWEDAKDAARVAWDKLAGVITPRDVSRGVRYD
jgi:hypothetical protein